MEQIINPEDIKILEESLDDDHKDSGMSSLGGSKDETPERRPTLEDFDEQVEDTRAIAENTDNFDDEPDETISERLWGLTEMFPERVRGAVGALANFSVSSTKSLFTFTCNASWIIFTSSMILFAPVILESELAQLQETQKTQQKQVLLGPGSVMPSGGLPALPPMASA